MLVNICHTIGKRLLFKPVSSAIGQNTFKLRFATEKTNITDVSVKVLIKAMWAAVYHNQIFWAHYAKNTDTYLIKQLKELTSENGLKKFLK